MSANKILKDVWQWIDILTKKIELSGTAKFAFFFWPISQQFVFILVNSWQEIVTGIYL